MRWIGNNVQQASNGVKEAEDIQKRMSEVAEEEKRHARAYGSGVLDFEQFSSLANELKLKKQSLLSSLGNLGKEAKTDRMLSGTEIDKLCEYAKEVLVEMDFDNRKRTVQDIIEKVIIKDSGEVEVRGSLPEFNNKVGYGTESRNCRIAKRREVDAV